MTVTEWNRVFAYTSHWYQSSKGISDEKFFKWQLECKGSA